MNLFAKIAIVAGVVILDRLTKIFIQVHFSPLDIVPVIPNVFNIVHAENPGAAFSMLADAPLAIRQTVLIAFSGVVMAVISFMLFRRQPQGTKETALTTVGLALVLGGALGNFWDRVVIGTVTDFLQVFIGTYEFPSFNVADSAIFLGACALIIDLARQPNPAPKISPSE
jgi:signal peptidase II